MWACAFFLLLAGALHPTSHGERNRGNFRPLPKQATHGDPVWFSPLQALSGSRTPTVPVTKAPRQPYFNVQGRKTVVWAHSISLSPELLGQVKGISWYDQRGLFSMLFGRPARARAFADDPTMRGVLLTSEPVDDATLDYYSGLGDAPDTPKRIQRFAVTKDHWAGTQYLSLADRLKTLQVLDRTAWQRLQKLAPPKDSFLEPWCTSSFDLDLAGALKIPLHGHRSPHLMSLGNKSLGRWLFRIEIFRRLGLELIPGSDVCAYTEDDLVDTVATVASPEVGGTDHVVVKVDEGVAGNGQADLDLSGFANPWYTYPPARRKALAHEAIRDPNRFKVPSLSGRTDPQSRQADIDAFLQQVASMGAIVEAFQPHTRSPSVQGYIDERGRVYIRSTHEQMMVGKTFIGAMFPAFPEPENLAYRSDLHTLGYLVGFALRDRGVMGHYSVDFMAANRAGRWQLWPGEINLRMGGTVHHRDTLARLVRGKYSLKDGMMYARNEAGKRGQPMFHCSSDYVTGTSPDVRVFHGLTPFDLIHKVLPKTQLGFDKTTRTGIVLQMIGAAHDYGKFGTTAIETDPELAEALYHRAVLRLRECAAEYKRLRRSGDAR